MIEKRFIMMKGKQKPFPDKYSLWRHNLLMSKKTCCNWILPLLLDFLVLQYSFVPLTRQQVRLFSQHLSFS